MAKSLKMVFKLSEAQTVTLSLADPKAGLTKAEVEGVMNDVIAKHALVVRGVCPTAIKESYIRSSEDQELA